MADTRNGILAEIVIASGGTVTDPTNRNSLLEDWLLALTSAEQRIFINNDDAAGAFYSLVNPIVMTGDFSIQAEVTTTATSNQTVISGDLNQRVTVSSSGVVSVRFSNTTLTGIIVINDGKLHKIFAEQTGSNVNLFIDGVADGTMAITPTTNTFTNIGVLQGLTQYFNGILANPIFNNNGTITSWNLDEATAGTETNNEGGNALTYENQALDQRELFTLTDGDWIGQELVVNGGFDTDLSGWMVGGGGWSWDSGKAKLNGDGSFQRLEPISIITLINTKYRYTVDAVNTLGQITWVERTSEVIQDLSTGFNSIDYTTNTASGMQFKRKSGAVTGTIDNVSVKRLIEVAS